MLSKISFYGENSPLLFIVVITMHGDRFLFDVFWTIVRRFAL